MRKDKTYSRVRFAAEVIGEASETLRREVDSKNPQERWLHLVVEVDDAEWQHDTIEEFFADYRRATGHGVYKEEIGVDNELRLLFFRNGDTVVSVKSSKRSKIESVFEVFETHIEESRLPEPQSPLPERLKIFIGHGGSLLWRELKDHLQDQHNHNVIAYEVGARAGHSVRDILKDMLRHSSFAILVMTGEDETRNDELHPRLNVVHELGLFQGCLGFSRSIVLLEEGTQEFSNIHGVHQIRFTKDNIKETFGDVLATLKREFPEKL